MNPESLFSNGAIIDPNKRQYSLLILGLASSGLPLDFAGSINRSVNSVSMISEILVTRFRKLLGSGLLVDDTRSIKKWPRVDFILFVGYFSTWTSLDLNFVRKETGCKKIACVTEFPYKGCDFNITFRNTGKDNSCKHFPLPLELSILKNLPKVQKSVLIDHPWKPFQGTEDDWTSRIRDWIKELRGQFLFMQMLRFGDGKELLDPGELSLDTVGYLEYLRETDSYENWIVTHKESYGFGFLDMIGRGIRVLSPPNFLPKDFTDYVNVDIFSNKEELISLLKKKIDISYWNGLIDKCSSYEIIVSELDKQFLKWKNGN